MLCVLIDSGRLSLCVMIVVVGLLGKKNWVLIMLNGVLVCICFVIGSIVWVMWLGFELVFMIGNMLKCGWWIGIELNCECFFIVSSLVYGLFCDKG